MQGLIIKKARKKYIKKKYEKIALRKNNHFHKKLFTLNESNDIMVVQKVERRKKTTMERKIEWYKEFCKTNYLKEGDAKSLNIFYEYVDKLEKMIKSEKGC